VTWRELFARLWRALRVRFTKQRMCDECGDALTQRSISGPGESILVWDCEACREARWLALDCTPQPDRIRPWIRDVGYRNVEAA
jgi:ribosomal protein L37AE/L43A